jgi:threonylcarbamoyladenosine tRNA methylthiotransferase MtaB
VARGAGRSRPVTELVEEARALATHHSELVLTGIHIGTYGRDWSAGRRGPPVLGVLLEALIAALPEVRFRLSSIEATEIDDRIARLLVEAPRQVAPHLHAPLQSGSDRILRRMGRHWYTARSYRARLEWLAARLPVFGLGADVIAGFPGETDADHRATLALLEALPFSYLHVFPFSARPGASAQRLSDAVSPAARRARAAELRAFGTARTTAYRARRSGAVADGVASGRRDGHLEIVTEDYLSVSVPIGAWDGRRRFPVTVA